MFPFGNPLGGPFGAPAPGPFGGPIRHPLAGPNGLPVPGFGMPGLARPGFPGAGMPRVGGSLVGHNLVNNPFGRRRRRSSVGAPRMGMFGPRPVQDPRDLANALRGMNLGGRARSASRGRMFDPTKGGARRRSLSRGRAAGREEPQARGRSPGGILKMGDEVRGDSRERARSRGREPFRRRRSIHFPDGVDYSERFGAEANGNRQVQQYEKVKSLKRGGMSEAVNLLRGRSDGKLYVEKRIRVDALRGRRARAEIETLKIGKGQHHLNQLVEYKMLHNGQCSMILEYCDGGSLDARIEDVRRNGSKISSAGVWTIIMGVSRGLAFLHDGIENVHKQDVRRPGWDPICHLDLKPCNIFISSQGGEDGHQRIVLADFGCCIKLSDIQKGQENERIQECGTPQWFPPEGIPSMARQGRRTGYGTKTDMFMLGATVHAACKLLKSPDRATLRSDAPCGSQYSGRKLNTMVKMLCQDSFEKRPPAREVARVARGCVQEFTRR